MPDKKQVVCTSLEKRLSSGGLVSDVMLDDYLGLMADRCAEFFQRTNEDMLGTVRLLRTYSTSVTEHVFEGASATLGTLADAAGAGALDACDQVSRILQEMYAYDLADEMEPDVAFRAGACFGGMTVAQKSEKIVSRDVIERELLELARKERPLLDTIEADPGISHGVLAAALGITASALTQRLRRLAPVQLLSSSVQGRNKYYYLSSKGERILRELKSQEAERACIDAANEEEVQSLDGTIELYLKAIKENNQVRVSSIVSWSTSQGKASASEAQAGVSQLVNSNVALGLRSMITPIRQNSPSGLVNLSLGRMT